MPLAALGTTVPDMSVEGRASQPISYDAIAADYAKHRSVHANLLKRLVEYCRINSPSRVLEVGCGTGNYVSAIAAITGARCSGLDPSSKMLDAARQKSAPVSWWQGHAGAVPFPDGSFDLVYSVDVIHHVRDRVGYFQEAFRVLANGGWFLTVTDNEGTIRKRALSHYFPETVAAELQRYPKEGEIPQFLRSSGFEEIRDEMVESPYNLSDAASFECKAFSSLHLISDEAFARGLNHVKDELQAGPVPWISRYVIHGGRKPPGGVMPCS